MSPSAPRLTSLVADVRASLEHRAALVLTRWVLAGVLALLGVAWLAAGPVGWAQGTGVPALVDLTLIVVIACGVLVFRHLKRSWLAEARLTAAMEQAAGVRSGLVRGSLELARELPAGVSGALAEQAERQVVESLGRHDELSGALGHAVARWSRRGSGVLVAAAVAVVALGVLAPRRARLAWVGLASPMVLARDPVLPPVTVEPGNVEVLRGVDVDLRIRAPGRATAEVAWQAAGDVARSATVALDHGVGVHRFREVAATLAYRVRTPDGARTEEFRLVPVDPLFVSDVTLELEYPRHTGLPAEEYRGNLPSLRVPEGTRIRVEGRASRPLVEAALLDVDSAEVVRFEVDGPGFKGVWRPRRSGTFAWTFSDDRGDPAAIRPQPLDLTLVADSAPAVGIPLPGLDTVMPLNLQQPVIIEARDDYGLARIELVAYRVTALGDRKEPVVQGLDLAGSRAVLARPVLDFTSWGLMPGDTVRYFARARDNAPRPHETRTREYLLRVPAPSEMRREAEGQLEELARRLEEMAREAGKKADQTRDMERQADVQGEKDARSRSGRSGPGESEQLDFEGREELRKALEGQQMQVAEVDSMRAELADLEKTLREAGQADSGVREDMDELQQLLEQIAGDELKERLADMQRSLDQETLREAGKSLEELAREQEKFRRRLEESLDRFRRAAVEQDFRATTGEAEELARQEQALADAIREGDDSRLRATQQEELSRRAGELQERMARLQERLEKIDEKPAARGVNQARRRAGQAEKRMSEAQEQAARNQTRAAGQQADRASGAMEEAARRLEQAQQQMARQRAEAFQEALARTVDDALTLARRQAEVGERMAGSDADRVAAMRGDEAALLQGVRNMVENLQQATQGAAGQDPRLSARMGRALEALQRTAQAMDARRGGAPTPSAEAEAAVDALNQLAMTAMAGAEQAGRQGQGQNGEQVAEQLEQLAQQQGDLFNQAGQIMPLQLGEQAMKDLLKQLQRQQESVASDLSDLADDPGSDEGSLGDLDPLAREATALAQRLAQGRLSPETVDRQEKLFHRLLDAGRTLEREEFSEERESTTAGAFDHPDVLPLGPGALGALRFELPGTAQLQRLSPAVRQLVLQYFERLNRAVGGGSGDAGPGGVR